MKPERIVFILFLVLLSLKSPAATTNQTLRGHVPSSISNLKPLTAFAPAKPLHLVLGLPLRNRETLTNLLEEISDPRSAQFRHYLTPDQFTGQFGPTEADYQSLITFAKSQGLTISKTHPNRTMLEVNAPATTIEKIFHIHFHVYQHPHEARTFYAPDVDPSVDTPVPLLEVKGLDDYALPHPSYHRRSKPTANTAKPNMGSGVDGTFIGNDFRKAYVPNVTLTDRGQRVGLFEMDGYYPNDPQQYAVMAGLTNVYSISNVLVAGFDGTPGANNGEVALDIEMVMSMAPEAQIIVYEAPANSGVVYALLNRMATDNLCQQLSSSWQFSTGPNADQVYQQMAVQGQTMFNSSGDDGAYTGKVTTPSDDPYITIVGGTSLTTDANGAWSSETVWNWAGTGNGDYASGGGISTAWNLPTWQQGISMVTNKGSTTMRNLPDVAMVAENVEIVANNGQPQATGGTSISAPLWAAFTALINQKAAQQGVPSVGFMNTFLYAIGKTTNYNTAFHDITTGNNTNPNSPTNFNAVPGYDLCTGWGTPTANLIDILLNFQFPIALGWTITSLPGRNWGSVAVSADGTKMLAGDESRLNGVYVSSTSGAIWHTNRPVGDWRALSASADNKTFVAATRGGPIYISTNAGTDWTPTGSPIYDWTSLAISGDSTKLAAGNFGQGNIQVSTNSGATWTVSQLPGGQNWLPVAWSGDGNVLVSALGNTVFVSTNNGLSYKSNTIPNAALISVAASGDGSRLFAAGGSTFYMSTNLGKNWTLSVTLPDVFAHIVCSTDGMRVVATADQIYLSNDGGVTWTNTHSGAPYYGWAAIACSADGTSLIAAQGYYSVYTGFFPRAPLIISQPSNQVVQCGMDANFSTKVTGTSPLTYQWYFGSNVLSDSATIVGSTTPNLSLKTVSLSQRGIYTLNVSNPYGSTNTIGATLNVQLTNPPTPNSLSVQPNGSVTGSINGFAGTTYLESSTNLTTWTIVTNFILTNSPAPFTDASASNFTRRFYRARVQ